MKKVLNLIFIMLTILPVIINASTKSNYNESKEFANKYIFKYDDYKNYIVNNEEIPFGLNNEGLFYDDNFSVGGLLNISEFIISKNSDGDTYLFDGASYWTMTDSSENKKYIIAPSANNYKESLTNDSFGSRITEFIYPEIEVNGTGTFSDPWVFVPKRVITFDPNGGKFDDPTDEKKEVANNRPYGDLPIPKLDCKDFLGWYDAKKGGNKIESNTTVALDTDQTLYAQWATNKNSGTVVSTTNILVIVKAIPERNFHVEEL